MDYRFVWVRRRVRRSLRVRLSLRGGGRGARKRLGEIGWRDGVDGGGGAGEMGGGGGDGAAGGGKVAWWRGDGE